jgi:hypothetical protein
VEKSLFVHFGKMETPEIANRPLSDELEITPRPLGSWPAKKRSLLRRVPGTSKANLSRDPVEQWQGGGRA